MNRLAPFYIALIASSAAQAGPEMPLNPLAMIPGAAPAALPFINNPMAGFGGMAYGGGFPGGGFGGSPYNAMYGNPLAGLGSLTDELLQAGAHVWAMEIDSGFFQFLQDKFCDVPSVELIHGDALKWDFRSLADRMGPLKLVANLPYSVSSRLLFRFFEHREAFDSIHVLLQREVAHRLTAQVGTKEYGILTVLLGATAGVRIMFDIPPKAFVPVPEVYSSCVRILFRPTGASSILDVSMLVALVKSAFRARRKTLRNNLMFGRIHGLEGESIEAAAQRCAIDLGRRAETLTPQEFVEFAKQLYWEQAKQGHCH